MNILYLLIAAFKFLAGSVIILLLLVLLLIVIVLAVPIKYKVYMNKSEALYVNANIKWLYSMVGLDIIYNSDGEVVKRFKVFGKVLGPRRPKRRKAPKKSQRPKPKQKPKQKPKPAKEPEYNKQTPEQDLVASSKARHQARDHHDKTPDQPIKENSNKKTKKKNNKSGFKEALTKIQSFLYKKELAADTVTLIKKLVKYLWPSRVKIELEIGMDDPADTGQLIAALSALYPIYYSFASIVGNYEKECFYGKIDASGSFTLGRLVYEILKYIRKASVKQLIKFIRKDRKGKDNGRKVTQ